MFKNHIHYSIELETAVIGAILLEKSAFARVFNILSTEVFYNSDHSKIFECFSEMFSENYPIDLLTVSDYISRIKKIDSFSGINVPGTLSMLTRVVVSTANIEYHSYILKQMWIDREIISLTSSGIKADNTRHEIINLQTRLTELSSFTHTSDWKSMDELMIELYKHQDEMTKSKGVGITTGFSTLDNTYGGFFGGQLIVIGARPGIGKSAFAGQLAMNMAENKNVVGFISLEMSNNEIAARLAAIDTDISFNEIYRNLYGDENQRDKFYSKINNSTANLPIYVSDKTDMNVPEIKAKAYKLKHTHGIDCLIIDYLQLVDGDSQANRNRENEVAKISRGFKIIAKELDVPLIVLCQLNREVEKRKGKDRFPQLSDFRESGAIEQDADVAMFLHSDFAIGLTEDEKGESTENNRHLVIRKWRNGISNIIIDLHFDAPKMKFMEKKEIWAPRKGFVPVRDIENNYPVDEAPF